MYIGDWQTAAPEESGPWHYVEPGGHMMHVCFVKPRYELVAARGRMLLGKMARAAAADKWGEIDEFVAELGCITGELSQYVLLRDSREARLGGPPFSMFKVLTTNRSSSCVGAPPFDDLVPVTELNRWWCSAVVEPENGPPGFDTSAGAIDPRDIDEGDEVTLP